MSTARRRNPCRSVRRYREHHRERFLTPEECWRLGRVLNSSAETVMVSVLAVSDGAVIGLFDGFSVPIRTRPGRVSDGRRRVKPLRGSFASLRPFG